MFRGAIYSLVDYALSLTIASVVVFFALVKLPGDAAVVRLELEAEPQRVAQIRHEMGLDRPLAVRYGEWITQTLKGNLGKSFVYDVPVTQLMGSRFLVTVPLAILATGFAIFLGVGGALASQPRTQTRRGMRWGDHLAPLVLSIPGFFWGILLILALAILWPIFPAGGFSGWHAPQAALSALVLPALALALPQGAVLYKVTCSSLLNLDAAVFVRVARAKGLSERQVLLRHKLRHALMPLVTMISLQMTFLLAGAFVIEVMFLLPGIGKLIVNAVQQRDFPVLQGGVMGIIALAYFIHSTLEGILIAIDPRIQTRKPS